MLPDWGAGTQWTIASALVLMLVKETPGFTLAAVILPTTRTSPLPTGLFCLASRRGLVRPHGGACPSKARRASGVGIGELFASPLNNLPRLKPFLQHKLPWGQNAVVPTDNTAI